MTDVYLQMILALALVVGMILLLGTIVKKKQSKDGLIQVLGYQSLGPKKGIAAVKIGQEVLVLGVTATDLKLFKTLDDTGAIRAQDAGNEKETSLSDDISDKLKKLKSLKDKLHAAQ